MAVGTDVIVSPIFTDKKAKIQSSETLFNVS